MCIRDSPNDSSQYIRWNCGVFKSAYISPGKNSFVKTSLFFCRKFFRVCKWIRYHNYYSPKKSPHHPRWRLWHKTLPTWSSKWYHQRGRSTDLWINTFRRLPVLYKQYSDWFSPWRKAPQLQWRARAGVTPAFLFSLIRASPVVRIISGHRTLFCFRMED